jgi:flagellar basal body-associated protein FliL
MKKGIVLLIVGIILLALAAGIYFYVNSMKVSNTNSSGQQYQAPTVSGVSQSNSNSSDQTSSKYSGLDLTPAASQTDSLPSSSSDIAAP